MINLSMPRGIMATPVSLPITFGQYGRGGWNMWHMMDYGFGGLFMWIVFVVLIVLAIYFVVQVSKVRGPSPPPGPPSETPLDILKKRYARGEITKDQFDNMKKDLEG